MSVRIVTALLIAVSAAVAFGGEGPPKPPELKVLDRLVGTWDSEVTVKPAEWTPKEERMKGTITRQWVLNGRFVEQKGRSADSTHISMFTYDTRQKAYRCWYFDSAGNAVDLAGQWDEATKTFTWKVEQGGLTMSGPVRFLDDDTVHWELVTKDREGKVLFRQEGTEKRKK